MRRARASLRHQLRMAYEALIAMGVEAFADRARHELAAPGEMVRKRTVETHGELTAQEAHFARLAAAGLTNPEIAAAATARTARRPGSFVPWPWLDRGRQMRPHCRLPHGEPGEVAGS